MNERIIDLRRQLSEQPDDLGLVIRLALELDRSQNYQEAGEQWEHVIAIDSSQALAWAKLAQTHWYLNRMQNAEFCVTKALKLSFSREDSGLMTRGITALKDSASLFRRKASAMSQRFQRKALTDATMSIEEAGRLWLKAQKKIEASQVVAGYEILHSIDSALKCDDKESAAPEQQRSYCLNDDHKLCRELTAHFQELQDINSSLEALNASLLIVCGALGSSQPKDLTLSQEQRKLVIMVRDRGEIRGPFSHNSKLGYYLGAVRRNRHEDYFVFDRADQKVFESGELTEIVQHWSVRLAGWASLRVAFGILDRFFEQSGAQE